MWWIVWFVFMLVAAWWLTSYAGRRDLKKALGLQKIPTFRNYDELVKYHELIKELAERERNEARNIQRIIQSTDDPNTVEKLFVELNNHNRQADYFDRVRGCVVEFRRLPCY